MTAVDFNPEEKIQAARKLCGQGRWPEVLALAQKWRLENPADHKAFYYLGIGHGGLGQFAQAETAYRHALEVEPDDPKVWNNLAALLYENLRRPAEAVRCMEQSLKLDPGNKLAWSNLAAMVGGLGHHARAIDFAERAIALDPGMVEAHLHKGAAARALGKMETVREVCAALAAIAPEKFRRAR